MSRGIYVVWWDKDQDYSDQVDVLLDTMLSYRTICLDSMAMMDPPNPLDGYFYNVYIHTPGDLNDIFNALSWGNGQGTDTNGYPFLTLPSGVLQDWVNNAHETFHIFQYNANAPGFSYSGDSQWYIEASANWFGAKQNINNHRAFIESESLVRVSHVPFWLSFNNFPSAYPQNWQRYVHQYALALFLYYLTDVENVNDSIITSGMYSGTNLLPQEYLFQTIGSENFRTYFLNWASHMTNDFDFISEEQAISNELEWNTYADLQDDNEYVQTFDNVGTNGWLSIDDQKVTNAWSFNTFKLKNNYSTTYLFEVMGDSLGSYGDSSFFRSKLLIKNALVGNQFLDLNTISNQYNSLTVELTENDTAVYLIVASMPDVFSDENPEFQKFPYELKISQNPSKISNLDKSNISVYPNPSSDVFNLNLSLSDYSEVELSVVNTSGLKVYYKKYNFSKSFINQFDLSKYPNGLYFLQLRADGLIFNDKLILQN